MLPVVILLTAATVVMAVLAAFLFGPVRAFLNRLLAVLPRVGEQAAYAVSNQSSKSPGAGTGATSIGAFNGHINGNGGGKHDDLPFQFIREEQIGKLPILLRQMTPAQAALVVAYLPPEWASRVLNGLDAQAQTQVMSELSQAREVPPEIVKEMESQVKYKLPYLVGGSDWIESVYQLTQPQTQRALLGSLNQQSPELAESLRRKTFFFEDLALVNPGALRLIVQEIGYPPMAQALRGESADFRDGILRKLPAATREIIQQELEMGADDPAAIEEAKNRLLTIARRLVAENRIALPERNR